MLYLEKSGLGHPGMKAGWQGEAMKKDPPQTAPSPRQSVSPAASFWNQSCLELLEALPWLRLSLASAEMSGLSASQGMGVLFLTSGCSQQEKCDGPDAHHLQ